VVVIEIFVSIDDNELFSLGMLMNRIFGDSNFLAAIAWEKRFTRSNNANTFYSVKDTVLVYRSSPAVSFLREPRTEKSECDLQESRQRCAWGVDERVLRQSRDEGANAQISCIRYATRTRRDVVHPTHAWKFDRDSHKEHVQENLLWWGKDGDARYPA